MNIKLALLLSGVVSVSFFSFPHSAQAGFEWTPPSEATQEQEPMVDQMSKEPIDPKTQEELMRLMPQMDSDPMMVPSPAMNKYEQGLLPENTMPAPVASTPTSMAQQPRPAPAYITPQEQAPIQLSQPPEQTINSPAPVQPAMTQHQQPSIVMPMAEDGPKVQAEPMQQPAQIQPSIPMQPTQPANTFPQHMMKAQPQQQPATLAPAPAPQQPQNLYLQQQLQPTQSPVVSAPLQPTNADDVVMGFGKDLPLVTAVRQLIPDQYTYKFTPEVNLGMKVSWDGGMTWQQTLQMILQRGGYSFQIQGNTVLIRRGDVMYQPQQMSENGINDNSSYIPSFDDVLKSSMNENQMSVMSSTAEDNLQNTEQLMPQAMTATTISDKKKQRT